MQRFAKPVAHTMETGIFTVTVQGLLKQGNNISSNTFSPLVEKVPGSCARHVVVLEQMYTFKRLSDNSLKVRDFMQGMEWRHRQNQPLNIFIFFLDKQEWFVYLISVK